MRVGFPAGPRLEWYDRNPSTVSIGYTASDVAPHGTTERASYTVPSGKKAFVGGCIGELVRTAVATTLGKAMGYVAIISPRILNVLLLDNTVGARSNAEVHVGSVLFAGQLMSITTYDVSTGGTVDYRLTATIIEFNA